MFYLKPTTLLEIVKQEKRAYGREIPPREPCAQAGKLGPIRAERFPFGARQIDFTLSPMSGIKDAVGFVQEKGYPFVVVLGEIHGTGLWVVLRLRASVF